MTQAAAGMARRAMVAAPSRRRIDRGRTMRVLRRAASTVAASKAHPRSTAASRTPSLAARSWQAECAKTARRRTCPARRKTIWRVRRSSLAHLVRSRASRCWEHPSLEMWCASSAKRTIRTTWSSKSHRREAQLQVAPKVAPEPPQAKTARTASFSEQTQ